MCQYKSFILTRNLDLFALPNEESHNAIIAHYNLRDHDDFLVRIEYVPLSQGWPAIYLDLTKQSNWRFMFDISGARPQWLEDLGNSGINKVEDRCWAWLNTHDIFNSPKDPKILTGHRNAIIGPKSGIQVIDGCWARVLNRDWISINRSVVTECHAKAIAQLNYSTVTLLRPRTAISSAECSYIDPVMNAAGTQKVNFLREPHLVKLHPSLKATLSDPKFYRCSTSEAIIAAVLGVTAQIKPHSWLSVGAINSANLRTKIFEAVNKIAEEESIKEAKKTAKKKKK